jgi:hypothetical protein
MSFCQDNSVWRELSRLLRDVLSNWRDLSSLRDSRTLVAHCDDRRLFTNTPADDNDERER